MSQAEKIFLATLAEQTERYDDMAQYMKEYMESDGADVGIAENRNLLSVAYKNVVGAKRSSWRIISNEERKCTDEFKKKILTSQREKVEEELKETCNTVLVRILIHLSAPLLFWSAYKQCLTDIFTAIIWKL